MPSSHSPFSAKDDLFYQALQRPLRHQNGPLHPAWVDEHVRGSVHSPSGAEAAETTQPTSAYEEERVLAAQLYSDFSRFTRADAAAATAEFLQLPMGALPEQAAAAVEAVEAKDETRAEAPARTSTEVPAAAAQMTTTKPVAAAAAASAPTTEAAAAARYSMVSVEQEKGMRALEVHVPRVASLDGVVAEVAEHGSVLELRLGEVRGVALALRAALVG
jgi:hypothetical protein